MRHSIAGLTRRVRRLEGVQKSTRCSGYLIEIDREDFETEAGYENAIDAAIETHRETCDAPPHGFIVAPPRMSIEEWQARHGRV